MSNSSVVPPMASEVRSLRAMPGRISTPRAARRAATGLSLIRMGLENLRSQQNRELIERAADASGANRENGVAGMRFAQQKFDCGLHGAGKNHVLVPSGRNRDRKRLARNAFERLFARGINFRDEKNVGLIEGLAKFLPEILRAREAMRLKNHEEALETAAAGGLESGANFGGVMAVIVDQSDAVEDALDFKAPPDAGKFLEALANQIGGNIERQSDGSRGGGVADVVNSRRRDEMEFAEIIAAIGQAE